MRVALAQIAPAWLQREATLEKITARLEEAAGQGAQLAVFGEALLPGYPFWPELTDGARFDSADQKEMFAHYSGQAVDIGGGQLDPLCRKAAELGVAVYLGTIERSAERGGFSLYATLVFVDQHGRIGSAHRKLMPTYEERLVWSPGDGHGLRVHELGDEAALLLEPEGGSAAVRSEPQRFRVRGDSGLVRLLLTAIQADGDRQRHGQFIIHGSYSSGV